MRTAGISWQCGWQQDRSSLATDWLGRDSAMRGPGCFFHARILRRRQADPSKGLVAGPEFRSEIYISFSETIEYYLVGNRISITVSVT